jgi:hypothetical protein
MSLSFSMDLLPALQPDVQLFQPIGDGDASEAADNDVEGPDPEPDEDFKLSIEEVQAIEQGPVGIAKKHEIKHAAPKFKAAPVLGAGAPGGIGGSGGDGLCSDGPGGGITGGLGGDGPGGDGPGGGIAGGLGGDGPGGDGPAGGTTGGLGGDGPGPGGGTTGGLGGGIPGGPGGPGSGNPGGPGSGTAGDGPGVGPTGGGVEGGAVGGAAGVADGEAAESARFLRARENPDKGFQHGAYYVSFRDAPSQAMLVVVKCCSIKFTASVVLAASVKLVVLIHADKCRNHEE